MTDSQRRAEGLSKNVSIVIAICITINKYRGWYQVPPPRLFWVWEETSTWIELKRHIFIVFLFDSSVYLYLWFHCKSDLRISCFRNNGQMIRTKHLASQRYVEYHYWSDYAGLDFRLYHVTSILHCHWLKFWWRNTDYTFHFSLTVP